MKRVAMLLFTILLITALASCGLDTIFDEDDTAASTPTTSGDPAMEEDPLEEESVPEPTETMAPTETPAPTPTNTVEAPEVEENPSFAFTPDTFSQFNAFSYDVLMQRVETDGSTEENHIVFKFSDDPPAQQLELYSAFDTITMTLRDDQIWVQTLEGWSLTPAEAGLAFLEGFSTPPVVSEDFLENFVVEFPYVGDDVLNGLNTRHFRGTQTEPWVDVFTGGDNAFELSSGIIDFWALNEPGLPVFPISTTITMEGNINGDPVQFFLSQEVKNLNQRPDIKLPTAEILGGLPSGLPLFPDMLTATSSAGKTFFTTNTPFQEVVDYHVDAFEAAGWEEITEERIMSISQAFLYWQKEGIIKFVATPGEDGTGSQVWIEPSE